VRKKVALCSVVPVTETESVSVSEKSRYDDEGDDVLKATATEKAAVVAVVQHTRDVGWVNSLLLEEWEDGVK
jgi:hypothetical protein